MRRHKWPFWPRRPTGSSVLRVDAIHQDVPFGKTTTAAVKGEIEDLAHWLELDLMLPSN
jgi:uncharacterized protein